MRERIVISRPPQRRASQMYDALYQATIDASDVAFRDRPGDPHRVSRGALHACCSSS